MTNNFWNEVNESIYWSGCKSIVAWFNEQYPTVTDDEYERIHKDLATQALHGDFSTVTKAEGYYLICENYSPLLANKAVAFGKKVPIRLKKVLFSGGDVKKHQIENAEICKKGPQPILRNALFIGKTDILQCLLYGEQEQILKNINNYIRTA